MTKDQFNEKWPMSKIPDSIRQVAVAWGDAHHWFIEDKVKLAQDILEATDKLMSENIMKQALAFSEWNCKELWSTHGSLWYPYQDEDNPITGEELYKLWLNTLIPKP